MSHITINGNTIFAVILVIIVILIIRKIYQKSCQEKNNNPEKYYQNTIGDKIDRVARQALRKSINKSNKDSYDYFRTGNLLNYNFKDNINTQENYKKAVAKLLSEGKYDATMIDTIEDFAKEKQQADYRPKTWTRKDVGELMKYLHEQKVASNKRKNNRNNTANNIVNNNVNNILNNTVNNNPQRTIADDIIDETPADNLIPTQLAEINFDELRDILILQEAADAQGELYYQNKIHWRQDPQNVHDRQTNDDVRENIERIEHYNQKEYGQPNPNNTNRSWMEMKNYIGKVRPDLLQVIYKTDNNFNYSNLDRTEKYIFTEIWKRINSKENESNRENLLTGFIDHLDNCIEKNSSGSTIICPTGRVTNALQTFAGLDKDPRIGNLGNRDMLRNSIFSKCGEIMKQYSDLEEETLAEVMETEIRKEYKDSTDEKTLNDIIYECKLGLLS